MGDTSVQIEIPRREIAAFCRRWRIAELDLFGSVLREDFGPESDIDLLVTFEPGVGWRLTDYLQMEAELRAVFGRDVDFVERELVEDSPNYIRRREILHALVPVYVAGLRQSGRHACRRTGGFANEAHTD